MSPPRFSKCRIHHNRSTLVSAAVDGQWYNLEAWAAEHPGGASILQHFDGKVHTAFSCLVCIVKRQTRVSAASCQDATDAFHSLHSPAAKARMTNMMHTPVLKHEAAAHVRPSKAALAFRALRERL